MHVQSGVYVLFGWQQTQRNSAPSASETLSSHLIQLPNPPISIDPPPVISPLPPPTPPSSSSYPSSPSPLHACHQHAELYSLLLAHLLRRHLYRYVPLPSASEDALHSCVRAQPHTTHAPLAFPLCLLTEYDA